VATDLNVDTLLTGTFLREGNDLRIACQLIDVKTENLLWKGVFDLKYDKLLTVQDQVAQQIIRGLELTLSASEAGRLKTDQTVSPLAYEYYLRGVDLYSKGDFAMAIKMLEKSIELAHQFAPAWAHLGRSYTANASFQVGGAEHYRKAEAAFARALDLQPDEIDARIYLANMFTDTGRVEQAVPLLREALKTNPNHAEIHWELGYAYRFAGMLAESVAECERARQLDPGVKLNSSTPNGYLYLGQYDRFLDSLPRTDDAALIIFYRGSSTTGRTSIRPARTSITPLSSIAPCFRLRPERPSAWESGNKSPGPLSSCKVSKPGIKEHGVVDPEAMYKVAQAYAILGDKASALRLLRMSIEHGFFPYPYLATDPLLDGLRSESEFSPLMSAAQQRHEKFKNTFFHRETAQHTRPSVRHVILRSEAA
jgi:tetratricopeptide (TPR) repeat protein